MEKLDFFPLSHPQKRIWYSEKLHPGTGMWNNAGTIRIIGGIDFSLLESTINLVIEHCHSLRTRIALVNDKPMQYLAPYEWKPVEFIDFTGSDHGTIFDWDTYQASLPAEYIECDLYSFAMLKISDNQAGIFVRIHHLISDAWSLTTLISRLTEAYDCLLCEQEWLPGELPLYWEYLEKENSYLKSQRYEIDRDYWNEKYKVVPEPLDLRSRFDERQGNDAKRRTFVLPVSETMRMKEYCLNNQVSVFSLVMSVFAVYLHRITGKDDFVIGTSILNRTNDREK